MGKKTRLSAKKVNNI